jgi:hypothetical protein
MHSNWVSYSDRYQMVKIGEWYGTLRSWSKYLEVPS